MIDAFSFTDLKKIKDHSLSCWVLTRHVHKQVDVVQPIGIRLNT